MPSPAAPTGPAFGRADDRLRARKGTQIYAATVLLVAALRLDFGSGLRPGMARALGGLRLAPKLFHLVEARLVQGAPAIGEAPLDRLEAPLELGIGPPQRPFRIDLEMAGQIGGREQEVADLVLDPLRLSPGDRIGDLSDLLVDLVDDLGGLGPVEPDRRGLAGQFLGADQGRQCLGDPVEQARPHRRSRGLPGHARSARPP